MNYWKTITNQNLGQEILPKTNHVYMGERQSCEPILFSAPARDKDKNGDIENFGFWFKDNAIRLLDKALDLGFEIRRYAGSTSNQYYILGDPNELGLFHNHLRQWVSRFCVCDYRARSAMTMAQWEAADGHFNQAGGYCCRHHGNTCGHCHHYDR